MKLLYTVLGFVAVTLLFMSCSLEEEEEPTNLNVEEHSYSGNFYALALPGGYSSQNKYPLIMALHGNTGTDSSIHIGKEFMKQLIEPAYWDIGAILVAPDCPRKGYWADKISEEYVIGLLSFLKTQYSVDPKKVMLTGFSMGGAGTWYLAGRHQDLFSSAVIVAGQPGGPVDQLEWKIPLYVIHSRRDSLALIGPTEQVCLALKQKGVNIEYYFVNSLDHVPVSLYVDPMKYTIPWLKNIWSK